MAEITTSQRKRKLMMMLAEDETIFTLLDNKTAEYPDDLINVNIFPQIKIDFPSQEVATYIGLKIDYPSVCNNELYKNFHLTIMIISNNAHLKTKTGDSRTDLLGEAIIKVLNWNNDLGFRIEVVSDVEDPLDTNFYYRKLVFKSITSNSMINGMKQND